jgi:ATP-binding cassette subfamily B protein
VTVPARRDVVLFQRLLGQARPYWPHVGALLLLGFLSTPLSLLAPIPLKIAVDSVIGSHPLPRILKPLVPDAVANAPGAILAFAVGLLLAVALLRQLQSLASTLLRAYIKENLSLDFRARLFGHVQRLSLAYHDARGTSDSTYRIHYDAAALHYILIDGVIPFVSAAITIAGMFYVTARIDWQLALVAIAISPALFATGHVFRRRLRGQSREVRRLESAAMSIVQEVLSALRIVKAFGQEAQEERRFLHRSGEGKRAGLRLAGVEGRFTLLVGFLTAAGTAAVLYIGIRHIETGALTLGELLLVMGYLTQLFEPLKTMSQKAASLQLHLASAERAFALLDEPSDVEERPHACPLAAASGAIAFRNVSFTYGRERPVLHDISFEVEPGTRLGIVGASGAGKSTLISLVTRFHDPTEGQILLDGIDLRDFRLHDLRRQFAVVPQDPVLFSASIAQNIAYARAEASHDEVVAAAQAANAHEFIVRLPQGYETQVGERGVQLSGGERQRIAIARAFLKNSPVLILDEPTSAVDAGAEAAIVDAISRLMSRRTVILITHRSTLLEGCKALIVLENGHVVADTTPSTKAAPTVAAAVIRDRRSALAAHPAVRAWHQLAPNSPVPSRITPLRSRPGKTWKTSVYRLDMVGAGGTSIIAKRRRKDDAAVERSVYEHVVAALDLPLLRYHGCVDDPDGSSCWVFMEDATGREYSFLLPEHRALVGRWLGRLHTAATRLPATARLPHVTPARYVEQLRQGRERIVLHLNNPVLSAEDADFIDAMLVRLGELEAGWDRLARVCDGIPETLVHGDFNAQNIRLRASDSGTAVMVFDWEEAGWGVPAVDLAQLVVPSSRLSANPDLASYSSVVREHWPDVDTGVLRRLGQCGTVFRAVAAICWESINLAYDWAAMSVPNLRLYDAEMAHALTAVGWVEHSTRRSRQRWDEASGREPLSEARP